MTDFLFTDVMGTPSYMWLAFLAFVGVLLAFDLGVLHRRCREIGMKESLQLSAFYIVLGLAFSIWVWIKLGETAAVTYLTGFVVEKSLAMDNIFVIAVIFSYFAVPRKYQHRVLIYGILGVLILRGIMIGAGAAVIAHAHWVLYLFAAFLILTGIKMLLMGDEPYDVGSNVVLKFMRRRFRVTDELHGERFFVRQTDRKTGRIALHVTPLFLALILVEIADVIFAVDSIPAIFAITTDPYIVYTSNIFAILGLRALYFALSALMHRFIYLKYALALVLVFIGSKIFVADMLGIAKVPPMLSLLVTVAILTLGIAVSLWKTRDMKPHTDETVPEPGDMRPARSQH